MKVRMSMGNFDKSRKKRPVLVEVGSKFDLVPFKLSDLKLLKDTISVGNFVTNVVCTDSKI